MGVATSVETIGLSDNRVRLFPNPITSNQSLFFSLEGSFLQKETANLQLINALGQTILSKEITLLGTAQTLSIPLPQQIAGLHLISLKTDNFSVVRSFIVE